MTLQQTLKAFGEKLDTLGVTVRHYTRRQAKPPFVVWQEDGTEDFSADDRHSEGLATGSLDYYTKTEYDPVAEQISTLLEVTADGWELVAVLYEEETGLIHYSWDWKLSYGYN